MEEIKLSQDTNVESRSQVKKKEQVNVENRKSCTYSLAKKGLGIAFAGMLAAARLQGAESRPLMSESSALDLRGSYNLPDRTPPPPLPSPEHLKKNWDTRFQALLSRTFSENIWRRDSSIPNGYSITSASARQEQKD
jgi:hypothetical protein